MGHNCWSCGGKVKDFFCVRCGRIQPISAAADFFDCLGLERKLNFDLQEVEKKFHLLSRKFHPDFYQNKSSKEQTISLDNSSLLNRAYRTLRDPISKIEYLLRIEKGGKEAVQAKAPPDLLEEVLELQEQLEDFRTLKKQGEEASLEKTSKSLREELKSLEGRLLTIQNQIQVLSNQWNRLKKEETDYQSDKEKILLEFRNSLSHRTYIMNIIEDIKKELL